MKIGLTDGLAGESLNLFLSNNIINHEKGHELLYIIVENISFNEDYTFEKGITGIGWLIAFLHQEKLININSDDILEDFDDQIYKVALLEITKKQKDIKMMLGLLNYFLIRHRNKNTDEIYFRKLIHIECINLITNELINYLDFLESQKNIDKNQITNYNLILLKLSFIKNFINIKIIEENIINKLIWIINLLEKNKNCTEIHKELYILLDITKNCDYKIIGNTIKKSHINIYQKKDKNNINSLLYNLTNIL